MKRYIVPRNGGPEVLELSEEEKPQPQPGQAGVQVLAAGVAFGDLLWMSGTLPVGPKPPFTPGYDMVGVVESLGEGVETLEVGQRVAMLTQTGCYTEYGCWPQDDLVPVSAELDPAQLICLTLNYITAYAIIARVGKLSAGQRVLVHGAGGGLGTAMLDLCRMMDIQVYGTASAGKRQVVEGLGATHIDYSSQDFVEVVKAAGGVDMVVDHIGGAHLVRSFQCLRPGGKLVSTSTYAAAKGQAGPFEAMLGLLRLHLWRLWPNRRSALLFDVISFYKENPGAYRQDLATLADYLGAGQLQPLVAVTFPFEQAPEALQYLQDSKAQGKVVLLTEAYQG